MRFRLSTIALAIGLCSSAHAAAVTLYLSGTFTDGSPLGGTITIDPIAGTVTAYNATVGAPDTGSYTVSQGTGTGPDYLNVGIGTAAGIYPSFSLVLATTTLVGYNGGAICNLQATCGGVVAGIYKTSGGSAIQLSAGTVSTTPQAPVAPSAPALSPWGLGMLVLMLAGSGLFLHRQSRRPGGADAR